MTKIDIFSGFLGAGKTTFIQKLIKEAYAGEKLVLIENEFGEIGIDGGFLKEAGIEITEMNSGCICCSLVGDFKEALKKVLDEYQPDRILIEPSGVGKLSDVIKAIQAIEEEGHATINHVVTVADVLKCKMYMKNFGEFYNDQITYAKTIVLSRTQNANEKKMNEAIQMIREKNENARILTTPWDELETSTIVEAMEASEKTLFDELFGHEEHHHHHNHDEECECGCHEHHHHHDHDEECECGCHEHHHHHDHDEECECGCHEHHHHHDHDEECECGCHDHHHHHDHDEECECGCHEHHHHHDHDEECSCGHHHHHHADEVFVTWGCETTKVYTYEKLEAILNKLAVNEHILRAKGIVNGGDTWYYFDMVPEEIEIREGKADYTGRLCVIGAHIHEDELKTLFLGE